MNHRRLASAAAAAIVAAGIGVSITAAAPASHQPAARTAVAAKAAHSAPAKVVVDCLGHKQVKPRGIVFACADGNAGLEKLSWTSWTPAMGTATGTLYENDCIPYCAAGHFHTYPVLVVAWGSKAYHGSQRYTKATLIFTGSRPKIYNGHTWVPSPQTVTWDLWAPA